MTFLFGWFKLFFVVNSTHNGCLFQGYGAGPTRPFPNRGAPINGGYSEWSSWSECTPSCGGKNNQSNFLLHNSTSWVLTSHTTSLKTNPMLGTRISTYLLKSVVQYSNICIYGTKHGYVLCKMKALLLCRF